MSVKTLTEVLGNALENLSRDDFERFCSRLLDRRGEPRVRRNRLEGKSRLQVAEVMVSTFTEAEAWRVAADVLARIDCGGDAKELEQEAMRISPGPGSAEAQHFVDKHRVELINRVTNVEPILDLLLHRGVLQQENYDRIRACSTHQAQMRELISGPLKAGRKSKDVFYEILREQERFLVEELNQGP